MTDATGVPNYAKFAIASTAGVAATLVCYPLEFMKTRMQVYGAGSKVEKISSVGIAKLIVKNEGYFAFYSGISASVLRHFTYTGTRMGAYQSFLDYLTENGYSPNLLIKSGCGAVSGALGGIAGLPADVALTRMAADGFQPPEKRRNYKNVFNALIRIYNEEGFMALYRGFNPIIVRSVIVNVAQMVSYSMAKETLLKYGMKDNLACHTVCSIISAFITTVCILPADMAKTRMQNMVIVAGKQEYNGLVDVWVKVAKKEGVTALWRGFTPLFIRSGPQFVVLFVVYEKLMVTYRRMFIHKSA